MKLRNKKTGEIVVFGEGIVDLTKIGCKNVYEMIEAGWEDYEEPKNGWYIDDITIYEDLCLPEEMVEKLKQIGNYFSSREEAEKAVEKLKAWKRLKDKQFKFYGWNKGSLLKSKPNTIEFACDDTRMWSWEDIQDDLDLLFGGEE